MKFNNLKGKKVFVTGGSGVIGRELLPKLIDSGAIVFSGDLKPAPSEYIGKLLFREGDLNSLTQQEFDDFSPEILIHLAAAFERSLESDDFFEPNFTHNLQLTQHIFELSKNSKSVSRVIYASSYLVYDSQLYLGKTAIDTSTELNEQSLISPRNLVGLSKYYGERQLEFLSPNSEGKLQWAAIRIFRGFGKNSNCVISRWVRDLIQGNEIEVYGLESSFDYIYSEQTAEALLRVANQDDAKGVFNLGSGLSTPILDIVKLLREEFPEAKIRYDNREVKLEKSRASIEKLNQTINWVPNKSIKDSIKEIIEHEKKITRFIPTPGILVSSSGNKVPLVESLIEEMRWEARSRRIVLADNNSDVLTNQLDYSFIEFPETTSENYHKILSILKKEDIKYVIPTRDGELPFYAKHKSEFRKSGIVVMVADTETIEICHDKLLFYKTLSSFRLPVIPTLVNLNEVSSQTQSRFVVKDRFGSGSKSIGLNLDYSSAISHSRSLQNAIFQPYIEGKEFSVDVYASVSSNIESIFVRERQLILDGESAISKIVSDPEIDALVSEIVLKLKIVGHAVIQIIKSEGNLNIVECNPRLGGASTLALHAGAFTFLKLINENEPIKIVIPERVIQSRSLTRVKKDLFT